MWSEKTSLSKWWLSRDPDKMQETTGVWITSNWFSKKQTCYTYMGFFLMNFTDRKIYSSQFMCNNKIHNTLYDKFYMAS